MAYRHVSLLLARAQPTARLLLLRAHPSYATPSLRHKIRTQLFHTSQTCKDTHSGDVVHYGEKGLRKSGRRLWDRDDNPGRDQSSLQIKPSAQLRLKNGRPKTGTMDKKAAGPGYEIPPGLGDVSAGVGKQREKGKSRYNLPFNMMKLGNLHLGEKTLHPFKKRARTEKVRSNERHTPEEHEARPTRPQLSKRIRSNPEEASTLAGDVRHILEPQKPSFAFQRLHNTSTRTKSLRIHRENPSKKRARTAKAKRSEMSTPEELEADRQHSLFLTALHEKQPLQAMALFPEIASLLNTEYIAIYLQAMLDAIKNMRRINPREHQVPEMEKLLVAVNQVRDHCIEKDDITSENVVFARMFNVYRDLDELDEANKLWDWLQTQDGPIYMSTYASMIELLAHAKQPISVIEDVFQRAITHGQNSFLPYHLGPNAITPIGATRETLGLPEGTKKLLSKVAKARLDYGDLTGSYLLIDTVFRLGETINQFTFTALVNQYDSLSDQYAVARLASREHIPLHPKAISPIVKRLSERDADAPTTDLYLNRRLNALEASLKLVLAQYDSTTSFDSYHVNALLTHISTLIRTAQTGNATTAFLQDLAEHAESLLVNVLPFLKVQAILPCHNTLMALARAAKHPELITRTLVRLIERGVTPDNTTLRILLAATGLVDDIAVMQAAWTEVVTQANNSLAELDWKALIAAVNARPDAERIAFLEAEAERLNYTLDPSELRHTSWLAEGNSKITASEKLSPTFDEAAATARLDAMFTSAINLLKDIKEDPSTTAHASYLGPTTSLADLAIDRHAPLMPLHHLYTVFLELNIDPAERASTTANAMSEDTASQTSSMSENTMTTESVLHDTASAIIDTEDATPSSSPPSSTQPPDPSPHSPPDPPINPPQSYIHTPYPLLPTQPALHTRFKHWLNITELLATAEDASLNLSNLKEPVLVTNELGEVITEPEVVMQTSEKAQMSLEEVRERVIRLRGISPEMCSALGISV
ncbi:hypothetical protein BT63DRAFT_429271 [Microthyrium microscopicum]|uniref:Uncharacterized protein n=1 Tax=Microthyrium microscopicum TaxID=703497 RepID=A0A6A6TYK7_9PEZI|nr:hypothetical protein BT63DRAFT_429271 [Microthyrium microscopicum]